MSWQHGDPTPPQGKIVNTTNGRLVREIVALSVDALRRNETPTDEQIAKMADELFERMKRGEL